MNRMSSSTKRRKSEKKNEIEILKLKNTVTELKILIQSFYNRLDQAEERINKCKNRSSENTQRKSKKRNNEKKARKAYGTWGIISTESKCTS